MDINCVVSRMRDTDTLIQEGAFDSAGDAANLLI